MQSLTFKQAMKPQTVKPEIICQIFRIIELHSTGYRVFINGGIFRMTQIVIQLQTN